MKTTLLTAILSGIFVPVAMAEATGRPEKEDRLRPEGRHEKEGGRHMERDKDGRRWDHPPFAGPGDMFKRLDKDLDGNISKEEFFADQRFERMPEEKRDKFFERLDRNRDGMIGKEEVREMRQDAERRAKEQFRQLDEDESGGLCFAEFSKGEFFAKLPEEKRRQIFGRMDTDGSGEINAEDQPKGPPLRKP
jgi:Ca2+-binding EF-hand superfamily protein